MKSSIRIDNYVDCIDGLLICTSKLTKHVLEVARLGSIFFCGRKQHFGLNIQGLCDHKRTFLDIDVSHPASMSSYLAFGTSNIFNLLEKPGF